MSGRYDEIFAHVQELGGAAAEKIQNKPAGCPPAEML